MSSKPAAQLALSILLSTSSHHHALPRTLQLLLSDRAILLIQSKSTSSPNSWSSCLAATDPDKDVVIQLQNLLNCTISRDSSHPKPHPFVLSALTATHPTRGHTLTLRGFLANPEEIDEAEKWVQTAMVRAYEAQGVPRNRRLLVIVNPFSGRKQAPKIWSEIVEPIFQASPLSFQVNFTTHAGHAAEIGQQIDIDAFDAVVCVSGDGLVHEFINGLGRRPDAGTALRKLSLALIPAGSGNALCANNMGPRDSRNALLASLVVIKGCPMPMDICSVTQAASPDDRDAEPVRTLSFLSTSFGLMADLDVGTDAWRWMGDQRFVAGFIIGAVRNRRQPVRVDMQVIEDDQTKMAEQRRVLSAASAASVASCDGGRAPCPETDTDGTAKPAPESGLPPLRFGDIRTPINPAPHGCSSSNGWLTLDTELTSFFASTLPFQAADLCHFPAKVPGDGSIDVALHCSPGAMRTLRCIDGAEEGSMFRNKDYRFFKTRAFRLTPKNVPEEGPGEETMRSEKGDRREEEGKKKPVRKSYIVVDGENMPYRPIQVEIHDRLANVLCLKERKLGMVGVPENLLD